MKLTLDIPNNYLSKALPLIEYLKSLEFVKITSSEDEKIKLTKEQKAEIDRREANSKDSDYMLWDDAKKKIKLSSGSKK